MAEAKITASDTIILFSDLQNDLITVAHTHPEKKIRKSVLVLAKAAKLLQIPVVATVVPVNGTPQLIDEIEEGYGPVEMVARPGADAFDHPPIRSRLEASGRKTLLISGVATEVAVSLPAISGLRHGFRTFTVLDACGGISERSEQAALARIASAGGSLTSVLTLMGELAVDFSTDTGQQMMKLLFELV